jgi:predicted ATPase/signal transduction histidine kinase/tRNA A-37 threonylcarbamoyl transferase component Bud32
MKILPGYKVRELVYEGAKTLVYRAQRESDGKPVILKLLKKEFPSLTELALFRHQYAITQPHNLPGIVKPDSLENYQNGYLLVMEDYGGISLQQWQEHQIKTGEDDRISIADFLTIALQVTQILDGLHHNWIVHKDIKPANILIHPHTKQVKLIDFSISSVLPRETQTLKHPNVLEGTLAYLSPEQTGRMNRGIDYRTDFYSLGVTFYELLSGELPFQCNDPMELLHCHIAKQPISLEEFNIPKVISDIVLKLMAKNAEERYQSAVGLKYDLEQCLYQWKETGHIEPFELSTHDRADHFLIPEKLYGREQEVKILLQAFERVTGRQEDIFPKAKSELMLITGFSGIGKTAVVNEIHKPIVAARGYFIKGKFDQFQRDIPFSALVCALKDLIDQLLTESPAQVEQWKTTILEAVGENGQVIIDLIPELEWLIGKQPAVTQLDGIAAQNRFNWIFGKFIQVFPTAEHPLVLFLDDLQWADLASLQFLQVLMGNSGICHLLILGAYRDNEVSPAHPLMLAVDEIRKAKTTVNTITLAPLKQNDLNRLIADTLGCSLEAALPLTRLVESKTQGNPFFSHQFLHALYDENLICFNREKGYWQCDLTQVQALSLSNDVVEFMAAQLRKLPKATQEVLQFAACIGNQFDLETLTIVCEQDREEIETFLWKALQAELILLTSNIYQFDRDERNGSSISKDRSEINPLPIPNSQFPKYKFIHDRVQQAAYSTIEGDRQQSIHLKIGQLLRQSISLDRPDEKIFEIVNHLNIGIALIRDDRDRRELAQLNLSAGQKAIASIAYDSALKYLTTGIQLLAKDSWETDYDLTLSLYEDSAEAAYLSGEFDRMEWAIEIVLQKAQSLLDRLKVTEVKILLYGANNQATKAVKVANDFLKLLGVDFPENPSHADIGLISEKIQTYLENTSIEKLIDLPTMNDIRLIAAMRILSSSVVAYIQISFELLYFNILKQVALSLEGGNSPFSASAYVLYGLILSSQVENIQSGYKFGCLANDLLYKTDSSPVKAKVLQVFNSHVRPWSFHFKECCQSLLQAFSCAVEVGDSEFAAYSINGYCYFSYFMGSDLVQLLQTIQIYSHKICEIQQPKVFIWNDVYRLAVLRLVGETYSNISISTEYDTLQTLCLKSGDPLAMFHFYSCDLQFSYLFSEFDRAIESADRSQEYIRAGVGNIVLSQFYFYDALARLTGYSNCTEEEKQQILEKVTTNQSKLQEWAHHAPMNFLNKYYLVEAERHRVLGNKLEAIELYDRAIMLAKEHEFIHEEALAYELAAKFYLELDKTSITQAYATVARTYMDKAYYAYDRWGAKAKLQDLEKRYPQLLTSLHSWESWGLDSFDSYPTSTIVSIPKFSGTTTSFSSSSSVVEALDLATVIKASQALSGQLELEQSIETLMRILLENVGAETGSLILSRDGDLVIEARAAQNRNDGGLQITSLQAIPVQSTSDIPLGLINYVWRTSQTVVLDDAVECATFATDPYIFEYRPKSVLCTPICNQGKTIGLLYLENNLTRGAFTRDRLDFLKFLTTQAAISLENSALYQNLAAANQRLEDYSRTLEEKVAYRTQELDDKNQCLERTLKDLQRTQAQLIQAEKMSGLGQLVSGVAHEINNPVSFISGNLFHSNEYVDDLLSLIKAYQQEYPHPTPTIQNKIEDIDLEFMLQDLPKLMKSMKTGCDRIKKIVLGLRNFSRLDESETKSVDLHEGIENSLMLLQHRLQRKGDYPAIEVVKEYGKLPEVNCYASQINQAFMNILNNSIDALEEFRMVSDSSGVGDKEQRNSPQIRIQTEVVAGKQVCIRITDNGIGMDEEARNKVFDPFFTTKPIGKGTGLGMSISYQIVVEKHGGSIDCQSTIGKGTEFVIQIPIETSV